MPNGYHAHHLAELIRREGTRAEQRRSIRSLRLIVLGHWVFEWELHVLDPGNAGR